MSVLALECLELSKHRFSIARHPSLPLPCETNVVKNLFLFFGQLSLLLTMSHIVDPRTKFPLLTSHVAVSMPALESLGLSKPRFPRATVRFADLLLTTM